MADFNEPQLTSTYTSFLSTLKGRDTDLAAMFANDTVSTSNFPVRAVRFNTTSNKFQRRNSANSAFEDLTTNHHFPAITIDGSGTLDVGGAITGTSIVVTGNIQGGRINVNSTTIPSTGLYRPASSTLGIATGAALKWTIDSGGRLFNNGQATHQGNNNSDLQIYNSSGGRIDLLREDTTVGSNNILGSIAAYTQENANDAFSSCAEIVLRAEDAHTTTDHSSRIEFLTTGGQSASVTPRVVGCFDEMGQFGVGSTVGDNPAAPLHVNSGNNTSDVAIFASEQVNNDCTIGIRGRLNNNFDNRIHTEGSNMSLRVGGNATPAIGLDSSGVVTINKSNPLNFDSNDFHDAGLQVAGTDGKASIVIGRGSVNASGPTLEFCKYRSTSYSLGTALQAADLIGAITFSGTDGTNITESHRIRSQIVTPDFSGNTVTVATGKIPSELQLRVRNNDGGTHTYMKFDHNGHIQYTPHNNGGTQNAYAIDIRTNNNSGTGNLLRFTEIDTTVAAGRVIGGIQFASLDAEAQNSGLLGEINVITESGNPVHGIMQFKVAGTEHITIEGATNHLGIHRSDPEFPLDVVGDALFDGNVCISNDRFGLINMNGNAALQVTGNSQADSMVNITRAGASTGNSASLVLTKNYNASPTANTACATSAILGSIEYQGSNGTGFDVGARIFARTSETWSDTTHGTNLFFEVSNGSTLGSFMCLTNQGCLNVGDDDLNADYSTDNDTRLTVIDASGPSILLHRRDSSTQNTNEIGSIIASDSDGGLPAEPSAKVQFVASQNHSATAKGTDIKLRLCQNGTATLTERFTFRDSGAFGVNGDDVGTAQECLTSQGNNPPEYRPVGARAWVSFKGTDTFGEQHSYNVDSLTDIGVGHYRVTYTTNMTNAQHVIQITGSHTPSTNGTLGVPYMVSRAANTCTMKFSKDTDSSVLTDKDAVMVATFDG